jgi:hypothetical protein
VLDARERGIRVAPGLAAGGSIHAGEQDPAQDAAGVDEDRILGERVALLRLLLGGNQADRQYLGAVRGLGSDPRQACHPRWYALGLASRVEELV